MTTSKWNIDSSHSGVHFSVRHMVISKVRGSFDRWQGTVEYDEANPTASKVSVRIDAASIDTREPKRDQHLRSPDFFEVEKYPEIAFDSTRVEKLSDEQYRVIGNLTMHGVTREIALESEFLGGGQDPWGNRRIGFSARASLNRKEFGLGWNQVLEAGGLLVGEQIEISLDVQAVQDQKAAQAA